MTVIFFQLFTLDILQVFWAFSLINRFVCRGGGGQGKKWHHNGRRTKKLNTIQDYLSCAKFLIENEIVQDKKLAGWGYSAGGLLVASAINCCPYLFRAAVLKVCIKYMSYVYVSVICFLHSGQMKVHCSPSFLTCFKWSSNREAFNE